MYIDLITIDLCPGQGGGVNPSGTLEILGNGEYDVYSYASASVNVHPSVSLSETYLSNGSYNISGEFNGGVVTVSVPSPQFITETLSVSSNGTYTPGTGVDGFSEVIVEVSQSVTGYTEKEITEKFQVTTLNNSASYVYWYKFYSCSSLTSVNLPECTSVGNYAFFNCESLSYVSIPVCTNIGDYAFRGCEALTSIELPVCTEIRQYAFSYCMSLSILTLRASTFCTAGRGILANTPIDAGTGYIYVPASLVDTYKSASWWSTYSNQILPIGGIPELSFSDGLLYGSAVIIEPNYIQNYNLGIVSDDVVSVSLPDCSYVVDTTFQSHYNLASVYMPSLTYVGMSGFRHCSALQSIDLPVCTEISTSAFIGCDLRSISAPNLITAGSWAFGNNSNLSYVDLPAFEGTSVSGIFNGCSSLSAVSLPALKDVTFRMFDSCNLYSITLPVASQIRISAFNNNSNLSEIYLPGSYVCGLGNINAFNGTPIASGTGSIYVPASLLTTYQNRINWSVFSAQIFAIGGYPELSFENGYLYGSASTMDKASWTALGISSADITKIDLMSLDSVTGSGVFESCENLSAAYLSYCGTTGSYMFSGCSSLVTVALPLCSVIEEGTFKDCTSLSVLTLPFCEVIGTYAFAGTALESFTIEIDYLMCDLSESAFDNTPIASGTGLIYVPSTLVSDYKVANNWSDYASQIVPIGYVPGNLTFDNGLLEGDVQSITSTYITDFELGITKTDVLEVSLPDCVNVGAQTFSSHTNMTFANLPVCTTIVNQGFFRCSALQSISIPTCEVISTGAFRYCSALSEVSLPSIQNIWLNAFADCISLQKVVLGGSQVVTLSSSNAFQNTPAEFWVPASLYNDYLVADNWSLLANAGRTFVSY